MAKPVTDAKKEQTVKEYSEMMKGLYGAELLSLYLFGEDAVEAVGQGVRPPKILAIMETVGPAELKKYAGVHKKWAGRGIAAPLMLTLDMLDSSTDIFPIEFLEMKESHRLLHGRDVLPGLEIGLENLRRQCEEQVKGKLIHLCQGYMEAGGDKDGLARLVALSIEPFTEAMRNVLRLMGKEPPVNKEKVISEFCRETGLAEAPFMDALRLRREGGKPSIDELDSLFARYLEQVRLLAEKVDKMGS